MATGNGSPRPRNVSKCPFKMNVASSSFQNTLPWTSDANNDPVHHTPAERKPPQNQLLERVTAPITASNPRGPQLKNSASHPGTETTGNIPTVTAVTPSTKSENNDDSRMSDSFAMSDIDDSNDTWRNHGKSFRANIVLADESNGGDFFALSDTCGIERYYRVADRVLEQFLSSNITERNELIDSYLVGNRLFKFLSVVLPTHQQYFSLEPRLEELRHRSESQLMELLEYVEELELMIDEMEYNRYILNDLTPTEIYRAGGGDETSSTTNEISIDEGDDVKSDFRDGESLNKSNNSNSDTIQIDNPQREFRGGSVKVAVQAIEASHQKQRQSNDVLSQDEIFKERVAAVLTARNNAELSINAGQLARLVSNGNTKLKPISSRNTNTKRLDPSFEKHKKDTNGKIPEILSHDGELIDNQGVIQCVESTSNASQVVKKTIEQNQCEEETRYRSSSNSFLSWDVDFSQFNVFSPESKDFIGPEQKKTHIDLLMEDLPSPKRNHVESSKLIPKIKEPPSCYPRSVRVHAQAQAAQLSSSFEKSIINTKDHEPDLSQGLSECSSDIFHCPENPRSDERAPVKTKIEKRMERAMVSKRSHYDKQVDMSFNIAHDEGSSMVEAQSQRNLLNQFRGCIKSLLD